MPLRFHAPLDPNCPEVISFHQSHDDDPISQTCGCMEEISSDFESKHRHNCKRCQEYGAANIEVED